MKYKMNIRTSLAIAAGLLGGFLPSTNATLDAQETGALGRLMHRAELNRPAKDEENLPTARIGSIECTGTDATCLIPSTIESNEMARRASFNANDSITFTDPSGFGPRPAEFGMSASASEVMPLPIGYGKHVFNPSALPKYGQQKKFDASAGPKWNPAAGVDEYVFDGNDRGKKVRVDQAWNVHGLETEDTIGHFDTLDGRRIVTPSNRVAIYAPRFGAVRRVDGLFRARLSQPVVAYEEQTPVADSTGEFLSSTAKQHLAVNRYEGSERASGFVDRTRGVVADTVTHLFGIRNGFETYENLSLVKFGRLSNADSARLNLGVLAASVWQDNLGLQVNVKNAEPVIVKDVAGVEELIRVKSEDGTAILRVAKVASKIAAQAGEFVDFTIRFDNLSRKRIGNVTIIDNLTTRLEYVEDSAECSVKADFITKRNDGDSLMLRWEIVEPLPGGEGGIIRFRCRVR